jgi:hypothetical protein
LQRRGGFFSELVRAQFAIAAELSAPEPDALAERS